MLRRVLTVLHLCFLSFVAPLAIAADVRIVGTTIVNNATGAPLRGFHANYQDIPSSRAAIEADLDAMKNQFGLKGFTFEIGWHETEPVKGQFTWNPAWDMVLDVAREKGLYVNLLLTPHYTPNWVYGQGIDVHNKDESGADVNGNWLNYAPSSPAALQWQGAFQKAAVEHFKDKPALISVNLTNEILYNRGGGGSGSWADYSSFANTAWNQWRAARGLPAVSMPKPSEIEAREADWIQWNLFRQDQMNTYFNTTFAQAKSALGPNDHVLVSHRLNWYSASDAYANKNGIYMDPNMQYGDILGGNNYGTSDLMASMMLAAGKPIFTTETSLNALGRGELPAPGDVNTSMLKQFFQGAQNQTIYKFGYGSDFPMRADANTPNYSFSQFKAMTQKIDKINEFQLDTYHNVGYLWPRQYVAEQSNKYWNVQDLYTHLMEGGRSYAQTPIMIYPSFFQPNQPSQPVMAGIKLIYALRHYGLDQSTIDSTAVRDWVAAGGILFVELEGASKIPSWLTTVTASSTTRTSFATLASSPFGAKSGIARNEGAYQLTGLDVVWARWSGGITQQSAMGMERYGSGQVVLLGTNAVDKGFDPTGGMGKYVFGDEHLNETWSYYRMGHNVLVLPEAGSSGQVTIPVDWLTTSSESYLMNMTSGLFTQTNWSSVSGGRYLFNVPTDSLLMSISNVPEPGCAAIGAFVGVIALQRPRRRIPADKRTAGRLLA